MGLLILLIILFACRRHRRYGYGYGNFYAHHYWNGYGWHRRPYYPPYAHGVPPGGGGYGYGRPYGW